jgi:Domain of unknown function (DUF4407)
MNQVNNNLNERQFSRLACFIIWCACADKELLKTCSNSVVMKYMALGFLILVPAVFALPSAAFFIKTAFLPSNEAGIYPAIAFGVLWSWVVLSFDRFLIFTFHNAGIFKAGVRLVMGGLISFILAEPLVLQMFHHRLLQSIATNSRIEKENIVKDYEAKIVTVEAKIADIRAKSTERDHANVLTALSPVVKELQDKISAKQVEISQAQSEYSDEVAGASTSRTNKHGEGPVALSIKEKINTLNHDLAQLTEELNQAKADDQKNDSFKKQQLIDDEANLKTMRNVDLQVMNEKTASIAQLKQEQSNALLDYDKFAVADFLSLSEELDMLGEKHVNVWIQKWLFTALLFLIDLFALALKSCSDNDDELNHKQTTAHLTTKLMEDIKQQSLSETMRERIELQVRNDLFSLNRQELLQLSDHHLLKMETFSRFIKGYSGEVNQFQEGFLNSPQYRDELLKEYRDIADRVIDDVLGKMRGEKQGAF